jgi:hypothetical protein
MALNEKMLPLGKTRTERTGDYLYTLEVVGWNDRSKCNVWAEKSRRYSPAERINTYQLVEAMKESDDWEHTRNMAKRINRKEA